MPDPSPLAEPTPASAGPAPAGPLAVRRAGVLLHLTSLPTPYGDGDLGPIAHAFIDRLAEAGVSVWQVLPLVPTHDVDRSPYNAPSAMAGNTALVSAELLHREGLLDDDQLAARRAGTLRADDARVAAARRLLDTGDRTAFDTWCKEHAHWLEDYVAFMALREQLGHVSWADWPAPLRDRDPDALAEALAPLAERLDVLRVEQWFFDAQWSALRAHAADRGVLIFGDLPIFVSYDSADVWASRELFLLDEEGRPTTVTGVPPDYFSETGQKWNNPHYDWDRMATDGYAWWRARIGRQRELFDLLRIDHFRGFESAWHVPAEAESAIGGHWEQSPGGEIVGALVEECGPGTLVAEDLGTITPPVEALRRGFGLPGMKILQFAFDGDPHNWYLPENHEQLSVVYTGTHDNDTSLGWWSTADEQTRQRARRHFVDPDEDMPWALVRLAYASVAQLAVVPAQDLLGLGSEARMNTPGVAEGNWTWQADERLLDPALAARLRTVVAETGRLA